MAGMFGGGGAPMMPPAGAPPARPMGIDSPAPAVRKAAPKMPMRGKAGARKAGGSRMPPMRGGMR